MTIPVAPANPHTTAAHALLTAAGIRADVAKPPDEAGWQGQEGASEFRSYVVLYPGAGATDGTVAEPYEYLDYRLQATCVAASAAGAGILMDRVKTALVGVQLAVPGRSSYPGQKILEQPIRRDDAVTPPLFYLVAEFSWRTQSA